MKEPTRDKRQTKMVVLDYDSADEFVDNKRNLFWDGWDIVHWKPNPNSYTNKKALFRNGRWGFANRFSVRDDGTWRIPTKYAN
jgi:hypothetical protein